MLESDILVYTLLGASLSVSVIQICHWLLNANPRRVLNAGQWSMAGLIGLTPAFLLWLMMSGRSTLALMLASFIPPVLIWGAPRWRALFGSPSSPRDRFPRPSPDFSSPVVPEYTVQTNPVNPELVRQCVAVLTAYLEQAAAQRGTRLSRMNSADRLLAGPSGGGSRERMSIEEALGVLGLESTAGRHQINEAHHRLHETLQPELGASHYLIMKIDEARDILLFEERRGAQA
jgi:hypothetical protein